MFAKIKNLIKACPYLYNLLFMIIVFGSRQLIFWLQYLLRVIGIDSIGYKKLKKFHNMYNGKRCFIVGTGPSLTIKDLETIKGEYSFSVNSIVLSFEDTSWRPTFYAIQDSFGYEKLKDAIRKANMPIIFNGISDKRMTPNMDVAFIPFPLNLLDHGKMVPKHITKFSNDAFKVVYAGHSITYSAMELAVYMGFKEIILLGVDCDYSKNINHIKAYSKQDDMNASYLMRESYKVARNYADRNGIKILNATRNAKLDVFEKVSLESVLQRKGSRPEKNI